MRASPLSVATFVAIGTGQVVGIVTILVVVANAVAGVLVTLDPRARLDA